MSDDVIPSFMSTRDVQSLNPYDNGSFSNNLLRVGEVKLVIYPEDARSVTKKFIEYDVMVQHREGGTATTKMYSNCHLADALSGFADTYFRVLRTPDKQPATTGNKTVNPTSIGFGSKVLILCINAAHAEAVIITGIRDSRLSDKGRKGKGIHLEWTYNGVQFRINDDGSFSVEKSGPTQADGTRDTQRGPDTAANTKVSVDTNGSFIVQTRDGRQSITIDNKANTVTVLGDKDLTLHAEKIHIGKGADESAVLGDSLVKTLEELIDQINKIMVPTAWGPSGTPINKPAFLLIKAKLRNFLSKFVKVKKSP